MLAQFESLELGFICLATQIPRRRCSKNKFVNARTQTELKQARAEMKKYRRRMELTLAPLGKDLWFALGNLVGDKNNQ